MLDKQGEGKEDNSIIGLAPKGHEEDTELEDASLSSILYHLLIVKCET